ncbi:MAG TPA: cytochrome c biogenesis protein CcdA [Micromonosporaceae bacterium]|jgi:cytochrome c-type biogenesis protein
MGARFAGIASDGPLLLAVLVAGIAGLVSFLSPCVLPLVPGYLSYVTGLAGADLDDALHRPTAAARWRLGLGVLGFIAGFTVVFTLMGLFVSSVGVALLRNERMIQLVAGLLIILLGLAFAGLIPGLQREWRVHRLPAAGLASAPVLGAVFAISWVPCIGPTLGAVLTLAATQGSAGRAATLTVAYCLGLGLPFLAFGLGFRRLIGLRAAIRRHNAWVTRVGGAMLVLVGLALATGVWEQFLTWLRVTVGPGSVAI